MLNVGQMAFMIDERSLPKTRESMAGFSKAETGCRCCCCGICLFLALCARFPPSLACGIGVCFAHGSKFATRDGVHVWVLEDVALVSIYLCHAVYVGCAPLLLPPAPSIWASGSGDRLCRRWLHVYTKNAMTLLPT